MKFAQVSKEKALNDQNLSLLNISLLGNKKTRSESIRETHAVMPSQLQALPPMSGYLLIADGTPPAKVKVSHRSYPPIAQRLVPRAIEV